jgi:integrase
MIMRAFSMADVKPHTMNQTIGMFKTFSKWLYYMEYTQMDVGDRIQKLKDDRPGKDPEELYLESDRLRELLDQLNGMDQMAYYMTRFLALTGLRIGEATALLPEDIGDRYISINKAYDEMICAVSAPKTKTSIRQIFIQPELRELINEYLKWRNLDMMAYGLRPSTLFYSRRGGFYSERLYNYALPKGIHPHILRHTHVALLAEQGMTLEAIARRLGHDGTQTTKRVYYHVTEKQKQKDEEKMTSIRIL